MNKQELIERIGEDMANRMLAMNKTELMEMTVVFMLRTKVQQETIKGAENDLGIVERRLKKSEEYNEQARSMLEAIMERWYHYD